MKVGPVPFFISSHRAPAEDERAPTLLATVKGFAQAATKMFTDIGLPAPQLIGVVTDSPNANKAMRQSCLVDEDAVDLNLVPYGCVCHGFNNFGKTIISKLGLLPDTLAETRTVIKPLNSQKFVRYHLKKSQMVHNNKTKAISLESATRWNYIAAMYQDVQVSKTPIMDMVFKHRQSMLDPPIFTSPSEDDVEMLRIVETPDYWKRLDESILLVNPIASLVTYLESDTAPLSMYAASFVKLLRTYRTVADLPDDDAFLFKHVGLHPSHFTDTSNHTAETFPDSLRRVWNELTSSSVNPRSPEIFSSLAQLALYLDEGTRNLAILAMQEGISLDSGRLMAKAIIDGAEFLCEVLKNDSKLARMHEVFDNYPDALSNNLTTLIQGDQDLGPPNDKAKFLHPLKQSQFKIDTESLMIQLLFRFPTSAAGGERCFSVYGGLHTKERNKLSAETLDQLVFVRMNTKQLLRKFAYLQKGIRSEAIMNFFYSKKTKDIFARGNFIQNLPNVEQEDHSDEEGGGPTNH